MMADPDTPSHPAECRPKLRRSWLSSGWLAARCVAAAVFSFLAVVMVAVGVQSGFVDPQLRFSDVLDSWLDPEMRLTSPWGQLAVAVTNLVPMVAVALVLAVDHSRRTAHSQERVPVAIRWRLWLAGLVSSAVCWMVALIVLDILARQHPGVVATTWNLGLTESWLTYAFLVVVMVALGALAEEVIFRGALPSRLRDLGLGPITAVLVSSAGFVAVHESWDPMRIVQLGIGALAFSWTVHRLGRLEFAVGAHTAWNLAIYVWNARSLEIVNGTAEAGLTAYSAGEWVVLIVMAGVPALLAEVAVRGPVRLPGT